MLPPLFLRLHLGPDSGFPALFLPLCLLWLPLFLLLLPLLIFGIVVVAVLDAARLPSWLALLGSVYAVLCATRGTRVELRGPSGGVIVSVI